ncbi:MAG: translocation/assembly module TamB domain-containing protein [Sandaracinaceae bacterium]
MLVALLALLVSVAFHLQTDLAGYVAIETATQLLNGEIQGTLEIGELQNVSYEKIVARAVVVRDPQGREVIRLSRLAAWPNWGALLGGTIYIDQVRANGGEVTLYTSGEDDDDVSLVESFLLANPSPDDGSGGEPPRVIVNGIVLDDVLVHGDVPGYEGLRVENVRVEARVEAQSSVVFRIFDGRGEMTGPYEGRTPIDRIVGHFNTDMTDGADFFARAHRGEDHVRARVRVWQTSEDAPIEMDLTVEAEPVSMETLAEMEIAPGLESLTGTFRGSGRMSGPVSDLRLRADVTSDGGRILGRGHFPSEGPITLEAWTHGDYHLDRLVRDAPAMRIGTHATLTLDEDAVTGQPVRRIEGEVAPLRYEDIVIPGFTFEGTIGDDALEVTDLDSTVAGGEANGHGTVGYDGSLDVAVEMSVPEIARDPNVRRYAPEAHGALDADLTIRADEEMTSLRVDGRLTLRHARYSSVRADSLTVRGHVSGGMPAPEVRAEGSASGLDIGGLRLGNATIGVNGGGASGYRVTASSNDPATRTRLDVSGRVRITEQTVTLDEGETSIDLGDGRPYQGHVALTVNNGQSLSIRRLELERPHAARAGGEAGSERVTATGIYRFHGEDELEIDLSRFSLDGWERLAPDALAGLGGEVTGHATIDGDIDTHPQGELTAEISDGSYRGMQGITGRVELDLHGETLDTDINVDLGERGQLQAHGPIGLTREALRDPSRIAEDADLSHLSLDADNLDVFSIAQLAGADLPIVGRITTSIRLDGTGGDPGVEDAVLVLDGIALPGWDPLRAKAHLHYGDGRLRVERLWVADSIGELVSGEAELAIDVTDPPDTRQAFWRELNAAPWSTSIRIASRRLDAYPAPLNASMPAGIAASASITAHGDRTGQSADIAAVARVVDLGSDEACSARSRPYVMLRATVDHEQADGTVRGFSTDGQPILNATLHAQLPFSRWITDGEVTEVPSTEVRATIDGIQLGELPYACSYGQGRVYGHATLKDLLTGHPVVGTILNIPDLRLWESAGATDEAPTLSESFRLNVRAGSTEQRDALTACAILGLSGEAGTDPEQCRSASAPAPGELISRVRVPVTWEPGVLLPGYEETAVIRSWNRFANVHAAPVLTFIPGVVTGDAVLEGNVELEGPWESIRMTGALDLTEGHVQIEGLGQHLSNIEGHIDLLGDEVVFPYEHPLRALDSGGEALISGNVSFEGVIPRQLAVSIGLRSFPVRREGMVLAWLTGSSMLEGQIHDERTLSALEIHDFTVRLPERTATSLQPLELHPQVLVVGSERLLVGPQRDSYPVEVRVDASDPFWVRRNDFAAELTADITATYEEPDLRIEGSAEIERGTFEIFGKRFELRPGRITFDGGTDLNPEVRILAVYEIPGRSGATVTVDVGGTLQDPDVRFSSTESSDEAEIIGLLVGGGSRQGSSDVRDAANQASSFVSGLAAGLLTLTLRQEFGDVIPMLAIETQGLSGTRVRVGFTADDLIPDFLRGVVTGLYIEGFVAAAAEGTNAAGTSSGGGGVGGGISVEAGLPESFLQRGTREPLDNGGLDLLWEP